MNYSPGFHDNQPIWWIRRTPIYLTTLLTAAFAVGMVVCTILQSANISTWPFVFYVGSFWGRHFFWEPITCIFVDSPSFFFLIGMFFFYQSAVEVEKFIGRRRYLILFAVLIVIPPIEQTIVWKTMGAGSLDEYAGSYHLMVAMFIAFATLYPNLDWFGWVPLKWIAFLGLFFVALSCLPHQRWMDLAMHLSMAGAAFGCIRFYQAGGSSALPDLTRWTRWFQRKPRFRVVPSISAQGREAAQNDALDPINPLLDKIAKHGIASLSSKERAKLEKAREALLKKDQR